MFASTLSWRPIAALALQTERQGRDRQRYDVACSAALMFERFT
jgi:hypothetical protein